MPERSRKRRPTDLNALAASIVGDAVGEPTLPDPDAGKDPAAVSLGRRGGLKGGKARAAKLSPEERRELARLAAERALARQQGRLGHSLLGELDQGLLLLDPGASGMVLDSLESSGTGKDLHIAVMHGQG